MDRRHFLASAAAAAGTLAVRPTAGAGALPGAFRIPAEFEPTRRIWLGTARDGAALNVIARIADTILPHAEVTVLADSAGTAADTRQALRRRGVPVERIAFEDDPGATFFLRDPLLFASDGQRLAIVDFQWSTYGIAGWCRDHLYPSDPARAQACASLARNAPGALDLSLAKRLGAAVHRSPLFLEGGGIEVNGRGTLLVSETLAMQRNPGRARGGIEQDLLALPGIRHVIWLGQGAATDPQMTATIIGNYVGFGTGSHTDEFVRFADPRTILLGWVSAAEAARHPVSRINRARMQRNFEILSRATDQDGRRFRIVRVPMPRPVEKRIALTGGPLDNLGWSAAMFPLRERRKPGDRVIQVAASSYLNYLVVNGLVLVPSYVEDGTPLELQLQVREALRAAFPGRTVRFVNATALNWWGGGIHCATNSEPMLIR